MGATWSIQINKQFKVLNMQRGLRGIYKKYPGLLSFWTFVIVILFFLTDKLFQYPTC